MENAANDRSLMHRSGATKDKVISKEKEVDGGTTRPQSDTREVGIVEFIIKAGGKLIDGHHKKVRRKGAASANTR